MKIIMFLLLLPLMGLASTTKISSYGVFILKKEFKIQALSSSFYIEKSHALKVGSKVTSNSCNFYPSDLIRTEIHLKVGKSFQLKAYPQAGRYDQLKEVIIDIDFIENLNLRIRCYLPGEKTSPKDDLKRINTILAPYFELTYL